MICQGPLGTFGVDTTGNQFARHVGRLCVSRYAMEQCRVIVHGVAETGAGSEGSRRRARLQEQRLPAVAEEAIVATHAGLTESCSRPSRSAKGALRSRMRILVDQHFRIGNNVRVQYRTIWNTTGKPPGFRVVSRRLFTSPRHLAPAYAVEKMAA
jgi:hypothetical protein